jgi:spermidine synthase
LRSRGTDLPATRARFALGCALFFLSGMGALVVETTWLRWFRLLLGATAPAASATLVAFFTGQALGAAWGARLAGRWRRPLRAYGGLEALAALASAAVPLLLRLGEAALDPVYDPLRAHPAGLTAARFAVALSASLPAAVAFGATLPTLAAAVVGRMARLGSRGSGLYGANAVGAAGGTALAAFWLPEAVGIPGTYAVGLGCLGLAAVGALVADRRATAGARGASAKGGRESAEQEAGHAPGAAPLPGRALSPRALLALAGLSGFGSFAAQVLLIQAFALVLNQSTHAFGSVLVVVLAALGAGALIAAALERSRRVDPRALLGGALTAAALGLAAFPALFAGGTGGLGYLASEQPFPHYLLRAVALAATLAGPALLAAALVFPGLLAAAARSARRENPGARIGQLVAVNTVGAIAGALIAPYGLLPLAGLWGGFAVLAALYAAAALALPAPSARSRWLRNLAIAGAGLAVLVTANPLSVRLLRLGPDETLLHVETTAAGVVAVLERAGERLIQTDNHYSLGGTADRVHQERQGHLPLLLHGAPRRVAFLGSATGSSAAAALAHPAERIWLVEIVPGVARAASMFFADANRGIYQSPRAEPVLDDARNFLRATRERFDVIVADLFVPWRSGTGALYTLEHFAAGRARLRPGGIFCQWLPLYQLSAEEFQVIAATFLEVFPRTAVFRGDFYGSYPIAALVGHADRPAGLDRIAAAASSLERAGATDRWVTDPLGPWALFLGPLGPLREALAEVPRNSDDRPEVEFRAARSHAGGGGAREDRFTGLAWIAFAERLRAAAARAGDDIYPDLPAEARRAADGGHALQKAGALFAAGRTGEASRALAAAAERIPAHLLAEAAPDPTAAEVWGGER